jgi:hypothetical protein
MWNACPFAGPDVMKLSARKRPVCAYEAEAYATATGVSLIRLESMPFVRSAESHSETTAPTECADGGLGISAQAEREQAMEGPPDFQPEPDGSHDAMKYILHFHSLLPGKRGGTRTRPKDVEAQGVTGDAGRTGRDAHATSGAGDSGADGGSLADGDDAVDSGAAIASDAGGILYAMLQRATITVAALSLTDHTEAQSARYSLRTTKVSAGLDALLRIARELRAWLRVGASGLGAAGRGSCAAAPRSRKSRSRGSATLPASDPSRPEFDERGQRIHYDANGKRMGLAEELLPFLKELDAAVEELKRNGVDIPQGPRYFGE